MAVVISKKVEVDDGILDACYLEEQGKMKSRGSRGETTRTVTYICSFVQ